MLSNAQNKHIRSLSQKKFRELHRQFIAEGNKIAEEWLLSHHQIDTIVATEAWAASNQYLADRHPEAELRVVKDRELASLSALNTANSVLLVVPYLPEPELDTQPKGWSIALDGISDPGNMGTLIRIADWFGAGQLICSPDCVDVYNPKVVQSAMGGHIRVGICRKELVPALSAIQVPKFAALLDGKSAYEVGVQKSGVLIIGNESRGISTEVAAIAGYTVTIPRTGGAESLNAAVSAGILCALLMPH